MTVITMDRAVANIDTAEILAALSYVAAAAEQASAFATVRSDKTAASAYSAIAAQYRIDIAEIHGRVALDEFWSAHVEAEEVRKSLTRAQHAGVDPLPPGAERALDEADDRCNTLLSLVGLRKTVAALIVRERGEDVLSLYPDRLRVVNKVTSPADWHEAVGDWGRSGRVA